MIRLLKGRGKKHDLIRHYKHGFAVGADTDGTITISLSGEDETSGKVNKREWIQLKIDPKDADSFLSLVKTAREMAR